MPNKPRMLDRIREQARFRRHYSIRTEAAYIGWIRRFILFHRKRHPADMGAPEIERFLMYLAVVREVSASTQNQALNAIVFLYREVLHIELSWLDNIIRAGGQSACLSHSALARFDASAGARLRHSHDAGQCSWFPFARHTS